MKFVPPDLRAGENMCHWQEDPSKIQQGRKSGKGPHGSYQYLCDQCSGKCKQAKETFDTVDLEELADSRERAGAPVLLLTCEGPTNV